MEYRTVDLFLHSNKCKSLLKIIYLNQIEKPIIIKKLESTMDRQAIRNTLKRKAMVQNNLKKVNLIYSFIIIVKARRHSLLPAVDNPETNSKVAYGPGSQLGN